MGKKESNSWPALRARLFKMVSVGVIDDPINQSYDVISTGALIINLAVSVMATFENLNAVYGDIFIMAEQITVLFFGVDYVLRVLTAPELYPGKSRVRSAAQYCLSATGIIDLLSFLPYYLPVFFPSGMAAFRMFRVVRTSPQAAAASAPRAPGIAFPRAIAAVSCALPRGEAKQVPTFILGMSAARARASLSPISLSRSCS